MGNQSINLVDNILINSNANTQEIVSKLFENIIVSADLSVGSPFDRVLFNDRNSPRQNRIIAACLLRLLCYKEDLIWNDNQLKFKIIKFFDEHLEKEYKFLQIDQADDGHIKLSKLKDLETLMLRDFSNSNESLVDLNGVALFRQAYMRKLKNAAYRLLLEVFIETSLISDERLNIIFESIKEYQNSDISGKLGLYKKVENIFDSYLEDSNKNKSSITAKCVIEPLIKLFNIVKDDFSKIDAIKTTKLTLINLERKYQFHIINNEIQIKLLLKNEGKGYAFDTQIEIVEISSEIDLLEPVISLGNIEHKDLYVVFKALVKKPVATKVEVAILVSWFDFDKTKKTEEYFFELQPQRCDLDWDKLKYEQPYSLEAVENEEELVGRNEVIQNLYSKLTSEKIESSIIYGQKRVGKTSIAKTIDNKIKQHENYTSIFIRMGDLDKTTPERFVKYLSEEIINEISYIRNYDDIDKPEFESALAPLIRYFKNIKHKYPEFRLIIILDEFDEIPNEFYHATNIGDTFFHNIRSLSSEGYIGFVLVGGENMQIIKQSTDRLNKFSTLRVDYFDKAKQWRDFQDLIKRPVKDKIEFSDVAILKLYEMTEGNPFFTKLICKTLYTNVCEARNAFVSEDEIEKAIIETVESVDINHINHFWIDGISEDIPAKRDIIETQRRKFLIAFSELKKHDTKEYIGKKELENSDILKNDVAINEMINSFKNRQMIIENNETFRLKPKFVEKWLVERGNTLISTSFLDQDAVQQIKRRENDDYVKDGEIVLLKSKWGLYRGTEITSIDIRSWLEQFKNNREKRLMFELIKNIKFYSEKEIREKISVIHSVVKSNVIHNVIKSQRSRHDILVSSFGSPAKSGASYSRLYAQENDIVSKNIVSYDKIGETIKNNSQIKALVFVDDIIGTGETNINLIKKLDTDYADILFKNNIKVFICSICGYEYGVDKIYNIAKKLKFELIVKSADIIYESDVFYNEESNIFKTTSDRENAKKIVLDYGRKLNKKIPLGYDECGLLVVFMDNCPDNTISIIWDKSPYYPNWRPLFERLE